MTAKRYLGIGTLLAASLLLQACGKVSYVPPEAIQSTSQESNTPRSCVFNAQMIKSGEMVTAYNSASAAVGSACATETRLCANGVLSGSYTFDACNVEPPVPQEGIRIDCGSTTPTTDSIGNIWAADSMYSGGVARSYGPIAIANTSDDKLYQTARSGSHRYQIPLASGTYTVKLHFAENEDSVSVEDRIFDVLAEGELILSEFDIFDIVGARRTALVRSETLSVTDGTLNIEFDGDLGAPAISAIEVIKVN